MRSRRRVLPLEKEATNDKGNEKAAVSLTGEPDRVPDALSAKRKRLKKQSSETKHRLAIASAAFASLVLLAVMLQFRPSLDGSMAKSSAENEDIARFLDWFHQAGGRATNVSITTFSGMGKGVIASADIEKNSELLFVPKEIIICQDTIFAAEQGTFTPPYTHRTPPDILTKLDSIRDREDELLTAFLLLEQSKGSESRWFPYIQLLPRVALAIDHDTAISPLFFNADEELEQLQDPQMVTIAREERVKVRQGFQRFRRLFSRHLNLSVEKEDISFRRYVWARFLINSRAFSMHGQRLLVPFGDFFNGQAQQQERVHDNGQHFLKFHEIQNDGITVRADRATTKGSQVFEDYGDNDNYIYFLYHGFIMSRNPFDCTAVRLPPVSSGHEINAPTWEKKMRVLHHFGVNNGPTVCVSPDGSVREMPIFRFYLKLYQMDPDRMEECGHTNKYMACFLSRSDPTPEEMGAFSVFLRSAIHDQLQRYPTTSRQDEQLLDNESLSEKMNLHAIHFRLSRKQILQAAQDVLSKQGQTEETDEAPTESTERMQAEGGTVSLPSASSIKEKFDRFQRWIESLSFPVNHLELRYVNSAIGFGTFASKPLAEGDIYLSVPLGAVMNVRTAVRSRSSWMSQISRALGNQMSSDLWLALHILDEAYGPRSSTSNWKPYLDMLPSIEDGRVGSPLFFSDDGPELNLLKNTDLFPLIEGYRLRVLSGFESLATAIETLGEDDRNDVKQWLTLEKFLWANAILDSRSIWWGGQRHLVPLLDMVNCRELAPNKQHQAHHTVRNGDFADTRASWAFQVGEEVVENYGQPNYIYLLYHGFVLEENSYDCAHLHMDFSANIKDATIRKKVATQLESIGVYAWTWDVCVDIEDPSSVQNFVHLTLLALNPELATSSNTQGLTLQQSEAAIRAVKTRLDKLRPHEDAEEYLGPAATYVKQQAALFSKLISHLGDLSLQQQN